MIIDRVSGMNWVASSKGSTLQSDFVAKEIEKPVRLDIVDLSNKLKMQTPMEGLENTLVSPSEGVVSASDEKLHVGTLDTNRIYPWDCERNANNGCVDDYFFYSNTDFLKKQAENIANGGKFDRDDFNTTLFASGVMNWFSETEQKAFMDSLEEAAQEYAGFLGANENPDLHDLQAIFSIQGEQVTLGQILDMRDQAKNLAGQFDNTLWTVSAGTDMFSSYAQKGVLKSAAVQYANSLPKGLGRAFDKNFSFLWDKNVQSCNELWQPIGEYKVYCSWAGEQANMSYRLFSDIDFSSKASAQQDFQRKLGQLSQMLTTGSYTFSKQDLKAYQEEITLTFNKATDMIFK